MIRAKKVIAMTFAVASLILLATAIVSAIDGPAVMVTSYTVEPEALMPGDTGTITLTIKNMDEQSSETVETVSGIGSQSTKKQSKSSISAEIETIRLSSRSSDIEWVSEGSRRTEYYNVGALGPGEGLEISIPIKAADYARDGTYHPEVYIEVENGENVRFPVCVKVDSSEVELLEMDVHPEISLSESKQIGLVVANNRPNPVSGVNVHVKAKTDEIEITPKQIFIGSLAADEKRVVNFTLTPLSAGDIDLPFDVTYKNGDNVHHNNLESSVLVKSIADVKLILVNAPEFVYKGDIAKIEFDVANGMAKDIKAVSVKPAIVGETGGVRLLPSEYFIGDMEVGDVFSASFELYTVDLDVGDTEIPFKLAFRDLDTDKRYELPGYAVHIEVKEPQDGELPIYLLIVALLVIIVVVAGLVWVKRKRGR
uniref:CARDB domain-containing protein n=1 Tax=Candidatus Methanophaga sp. ANME-1 ERB7 TaxID=2759913 RepID=A0A7G9Z1X2_9EURY|nr:hypothetical protein IIFEDBNN_00040 [Methanosarcinales archaeon ANME-1 ERB7]